MRAWLLGRTMANNETEENSLNIAIEAVGKVNESGLIVEQQVDCNCHQN